MGGVGMMMGFEILILGVIVWAVVQAMSRGSLGVGTRLASSQSAKETLDARLARGEVSVEEYRKLRETLEAQSTALPTT
jgi:uncharacterized membrane protein